MGYLQETPSWDEGVPYFAADAILTGGPDCPDNIPIQALTNRTAYLKGLVEEVGAGSVRLVGDQRIEGRKDFADSPLVPNVPAGATGKQAVNAAFVNNALSKAAGLPLLFPLWCPNRAAIPAGYAPADGQTLSRSLYPDAWAGIAAGNVPVATDTAWLATPTSRGAFTAGDGATTFRLPDYNGRAAGSLGAVFMRGDGALSAGTDGVIQGDAIRNIAGSYCDVVFNRAAAATGALSQGAAVVTGTGASGSGLSGYAMTFDASRVVPTANENRPLNVTGCWVIRLFGAVVNPGAVDAAQLATEVSKLRSDSIPWSAVRMGTAQNDYALLPGGLILQWGHYPSLAGNSSVPITFPLAFPSACLNVSVSSDRSLTVNTYTPTTSTPTTTGFRLYNTDGGNAPFYWFAIGR